MFIKQITIQGFKSYKNETIIDSFSPDLNVVVGRNGSGKSNFFSAVRFVLSDAYVNLSREERQSLIHEGSGTVMSAFVEVLFDNTDRRLPVDKDEVAVRRTIGMKKDDYSLNSRSVSRSDVMNLLESAGFSKSNPYYIVPQGRVTSITNSKDSEKLELLKEVAGANVFETKLRDSEREMNSATKKQEQIDEMLRYIDLRLDDLDMEREDLKEFEKYNDQKKVLEYNLLDREIKNLGSQIDGIDNDYTEAVDDSSELVRKLDDGEKQFARLQEEITDLKSSRKLVNIDKQENIKEVEDSVQKIGETQAAIKAVQLEAAEASGAASLKLEETRQSIADKREELAELNPQVEQLQQDDERIKAELKQLQLTQRSLLAKRGRSVRFKSQQQRDAWLQSEISTLQQTIASKDSEIQSLESVVKSTEGTLEAKYEQKAKLQQDSEDSRLTELETELYELKQQCSKLIDARKLLWREESKLNSVVQTYEEDKTRAQEELGETMDSSLWKGLESVQRIAKKLNLDGVYGPLGELIDVSEKYKTAVETVGGRALFYVVVNNDQTASLIMDQLIAEKAGRVTFMPLNRLHPRKAQYPDGNDSVPLIKKISYEDYLAPAVEQVFGNTVVCISLERGAELARSNGVASVTLDGDRVNNSGVLSGGFREQGKSRVDCLKKISRWKSEIALVNEKLDSIKSDIGEKDSEITKSNEQVTLKRKQLDALFEEKDVQESAITKLESEIAAGKQELESYKGRVQSLQSAQQLLEKQLAQYQSELESEFNASPLTSDEEQSLSQLETQIPSLIEEYTKNQETLDQLEVKHSAVESELNEKLVPLQKRLIKLASKSKRSASRSLALRLDDLKSQLDVYQTSKVELEEIGGELSEKLASLDEDIDAKQAELDKLDESQKMLVRKLEGYSKTSEKSLGKKLALRNRRDDINRKIKDLGLLPDNAFDEYTETSSGDILTQLNEVNNELKKFGHVNKKSLEQYINFNKQRNSLVSRRAELDNAKESIEELVGVLQGRKNEAIVRTFKEVSANFTKIFAKLVPQGAGRLVIQKRDDDSNQVESLTQLPADADDMDIDDDNNVSNATDNYIGVTMAVSFNSKRDEQQRIEQLSGGQKSLCALALILAIQKCDPAPFYLFDEIDANLDAQYRTSVASLIHGLSRDAQFICTTFRPEMVNVADNFFGVLFNNKVSSVSEITKDEALGFVEGLNAQ